MEEKKQEITEIKPETNNNNSKAPLELPYDVSMNLFDSMINSLARSGSKGENIGDLYKTLNTITAIASKTTSLLRYLGLIETNGYKIALTTEGFVFANSPIEEKRNIVMKSLPKNYKIMLSWLKSSKDGSMTTQEIKSSIIKMFNLGLSQRLLDGVVVSFCNFFSHLGIVDYTKGKGSKCTITELGKSLLDGNFTSQQTPGFQPNNPTKNPLEGKENTLNLSLEGKFPIMIVSKGVKPLDWDIHEEEDWDHVESYLKSLKNRWRKNHMRKSSGTSEGSAEKNER